MRCVIVGHGESLRGTEGIDDLDLVVRLKRAEKIAGKRTDVICASTADHIRNNRTFWHFAPKPHGRSDHKLDYKKWIAYLEKFGGKYWKPSIGCAACFFVKEIYDPPEIWLAGFDSHFGNFNKYDSERLGSVHDFGAEKRCIHSLFKVNYLGTRHLRESQDSDHELDS